MPNEREKSRTNVELNVMVRWTLRVQPLTVCRPSGLVRLVAVFRVYCNNKVKYSGWGVKIIVFQFFFENNIYYLPLGRHLIIIIIIVKSCVGRVAVCHARLMS